MPDYFVIEFNLSNLLGKLVLVRRQITVFSNIIVVGDIDVFICAGGS